MVPGAKVPGASPKHYAGSSNRPGTTPPRNARNRHGRLGSSLIHLTSLPPTRGTGEQPRRAAPPSVGPACLPAGTAFCPAPGSGGCGRAPTSAVTAGRGAVLSGCRMRENGKLSGRRVRFPTFLQMSGKFSKIPYWRYLIVRESVISVRPSGHFFGVGKGRQDKLNVHLLFCLFRCEWLSRGETPLYGNLKPFLMALSDFSDGFIAT